MGKKLICAAVLVACLITGLSAAFAAPGAPEDPFVTLSYLTGTYLPQVEQNALKRVDDAAAKTEQDALDQLAKLTGSYLSQIGPSDNSSPFERLTLAQGDRLTVSAGSDLLFESGAHTLSTTGTVLDVTDGAPKSPKAALVDGHRYIVAGNSQCTLTVLSGTVNISVQGVYTLTEAEKSTLPFTDVAVEDWHYSYVKFAYEQGLFQGTSQTQFSPNTNMNRAMLVTVLSRLAGVEPVEGECRFLDVEDNSWYEGAVNWAAGVGIVNGVNQANNLFAPNANVTREQMAVMLYRYAQDYLGTPLSPSGDLSAFPDQNTIADWAKPAVSWAVDTGIINGRNGMLAPGGTATRAEVATMLQRFSALLPS